MPDLLVRYLAADRLGTVLAAVAVAVIFAVVKHRERIRPTRGDSDG